MEEIGLVGEIPRIRHETGKVGVGIFGNWPEARITFPNLSNPAASRNVLELQVLLLLLLHVERKKLLLLQFLRPNKSTNARTKHVMWPVAMHARELLFE